MQKSMQLALSIAYSTLAYSGYGPSSCRALPASGASLPPLLTSEQIMSHTPHTNGSSAKPRPVRDANGRFVNGNPGGPGNPFARKVAALRKALIHFVTVDDMKHVAFILKEKAMGGDLVAIKLLFQYVLGKPAETVDPDRLDIEEAKIQDEHYEAVEEPAMMAEIYGRATEAEETNDEEDEEYAEDEPS